MASRPDTRKTVFSVAARLFSYYNFADPAAMRAQPDIQSVGLFAQNLSESVPLLGVVCFLRQRFAPGGGFPRGLAFGSRLVVSNAPHARPQAVFGSIHATCLSALVTDRVMEEWYCIA
jgi:hypothetical protein